MKTNILPTIFCSFVLLLTPFSSLYAASNADETYHGEKLVFNFPENQQADWQLELALENFTTHFQSWSNKHDDQFVTAGTHLQTPGNPITIEEKFTAFIEGPHLFVIETLEKSENEMLFVIQDIQDPEGNWNWGEQDGFVCVRLIVTPNAHHMLSFSSDGLLEVDEKEKWILWLQEAEFNEGSITLS